MSDQSESLVPPPVVPSVTWSTHWKSGEATHVNDLASQLALALCCIDGLLELIQNICENPTSKVRLDTFRTDNLQPATITRDGTFYILDRRQLGECKEPK